MITLTPLELANVAISGYGAMQKLPELAALIDLVDSGAPQTVLEIGIGKGGTSWAWSKLSTVATIVAIDLPGGPWGGGPEQATLQHIASNTQAKYTYIAGNSQNSEAYTAAVEALGGKVMPSDTDTGVALSFAGCTPVDFLFIDGDHSYAGVKADYERYSPLVRKGGLIAFHDICEHAPETGCDVRKYWLELRATLAPKNYTEFVSTPESWGGISAIRYGA